MKANQSDRAKQVSRAVKADAVNTYNMAMQSLDFKGLANRLTKLVNLLKSKK